MRCYRVLERFAAAPAEALAGPRRPADVPVRAPHRGQARAASRRGVDVVDFGIGEPREETPRRSSARRSPRRSTPQSTYPLAEGLPELRAAIAALDRAALRRRRWTPAPRSSRRSAPRRRSSTSPRSSAATSWPCTTPGYPVAERGALFAGKRGARAAAARRARLPARPRRRRRRHLGPRRRSCGSTTRTTRRPRPRRSSSTSAPPRSRASTTSCSPPTRPTPRSTSATEPPVSALAGRRPPQRRRASTRSPSARRCPATARGFVAGDPEVIAALKRYRPNVGVAPQEFVQRAAVAAWGDEAHVEDVRALYRAKRDVLLPVLEAAGMLPRRRRRDVLPLARRRRARRRAGRRAARARRRRSRRARSSARPARASCGSRSCRRSRSASGRPTLLASVVGVQGGVEAAPGA